jgi:hypothetical protein
MSDHSNPAERYRELAEGCRRLAAIGVSTETRNHFLRMAEHYSMLAEVHYSMLAEVEEGPVADYPTKADDDN